MYEITASTLDWFGLYLAIYFSPNQFLYCVGVYVMQNNETENGNLIRGLRTVSGIVSYLTETQKTETLNKLQQLQTYST